MKACYFYDSPFPSRFAAWIQILQTCWHLAETGVEVMVLTGPLQGSSNLSGALATYGLVPHRRLTVLPASPSRNLKRLRDWIRSTRGGSRPIVISRGEIGASLWHRLVSRDRDACRFVFESHRPCNPTARISRWPQLQWVGRFLPGLQIPIAAAERAAVEGADGLICLTSGVRDALAEQYQIPNHSLILPSGTSVKTGVGEKISTESGENPDRDIDVVYAGKLVRYKGVYDLVAAMPMLNGRQVVMLGGDATEVAALREYARCLGVADRLVTPGFVDPVEIPGYLSRARVAACPLPSGVDPISERFTSPLKLLEYMAYGVPIVATDLPTICDIVEPDQHALIVQPGDPKALAAAIERLLDDPTTADRLRSAALLRIHDFSWENRARRLRDWLAELP